MEKIKELNDNIKDAISKEKIAVRSGLKVRGSVISTKTKKTATISSDSTKKVSKYGRYARTRRKIHIHIPEGIELKVGDVVEARPTRKTSKTKSFVLYSIIKRE